MEDVNFDKNLVSTAFIAEVGTIDTTVGINENIRELLRANSMQEFVAIPSDRELAMLMNQAMSNLNNVNPVTTLVTSEAMKKRNLYELLIRLTMIEFIKIIIIDYTHTGISDTSIEDIAVIDRQPRYEALLAMLDEAKVLEAISRVKKALGIGIDVEVGKAMGKIRTNHYINDFDAISRY